MSETQQIPQTHEAVAFELMKCIVAWDESEKHKKTKDDRLALYNECLKVVKGYRLKE